MQKVRQVIHRLIRLCLQLIMLKWISLQTDHLGMMINEGVKCIAHAYPYWATTLMCVTGVKDEL